MKVRLARLVPLCAAGILSAPLLPSVAEAQHAVALPESKPFAQPTPSDLAVPSGFPVLGKWMYTAAGVPAQWLGEAYRGKSLREPINVLVVDGFATSAEDAKHRLIVACGNAGYPARTGHSSDYLGFVGDRFFRQLPEQAKHAFSNGPFELDNNHGRVFGPAVQVRGSGVTACRTYCFIAAFSRENVDPVTKIKHRYGSFIRARDEFTQKMDEHTQFRISGLVWLDNAVIGDPLITTGDHDGIAVLLTAAR